MKCRVNTSGHFPERFSKDSVSSLRFSNRNCLRQILASKWPNIKWSFCEITSYGKYCNFIGGCQVISRLSLPFKFVHVTKNFQHYSKREQENKKMFLTIFDFLYFFLIFFSGQYEIYLYRWGHKLSCLFRSFDMSCCSLSINAGQFAKHLFYTSGKYVLILESMQYSLLYNYFRFIITFDRNAIFSSSLPQSTLFQSLRRKWLNSLIKW